MKKLTIILLCLLPLTSCVTVFNKFYYQTLGIKKKLPTHSSKNTFPKRDYYIALLEKKFTQCEDIMHGYTLLKEEKNAAISHLAVDTLFHLFQKSEAYRSYQKSIATEDPLTVPWVSDALHEKNEFVRMCYSSYFNEKKTSPLLFGLIQRNDSITIITNGNPNYSKKEQSPLTWQLIVEKLFFTDFIKPTHYVNIFSKELQSGKSPNTHSVHLPSSGVYRITCTRKDNFKQYFVSVGSISTLGRISPQKIFINAYSKDVTAPFNVYTFLNNGVYFSTTTKEGLYYGKNNLQNHKTPPITCIEKNGILTILSQDESQHLKPIVKNNNPRYKRQKTLKKHHGIICQNRFFPSQKKIDLYFDIFGTNGIPIDTSFHCTVLHSNFSVESNLYISEEGGTFTVPASSISTGDSLSILLYNNPRKENLIKEFHIPINIKPVERHNKKIISIVPLKNRTGVKLTIDKKYQHHFLWAIEGSDIIKPYILKKDTASEIHIKTLEHDKKDMVLTVHAFNGQEYHSKEYPMPASTINQVKEYQQVKPITLPALFYMQNKLGITNRNDISFIGGWKINPYIKRKEAIKKGE